MLQTTDREGTYTIWTIFPASRHGIAIWTATNTPAAHDMLMYIKKIVFTGSLHILSSVFDATKLSSVCRSGPTTGLFHSWWFCGPLPRKVNV